MDEQWNLSQLEDIDNTVRYELYLPRPPNDDLIEKYKKHVASVVLRGENLIKFRLKKHDKYNLLYGSLKFNQNIEEEWLIVYILYKLSTYDRDLVIRVHDNDGDTLLIEAAEHLPLWLESSKSKNRVFIHDGNLHIIPESINLHKLRDNYRFSSSSSSETVPSIAQAAAQFIRDMNSNNSNQQASGDALVMATTSSSAGSSTASTPTPAHPAAAAAAASANCGTGGLVGRVSTLAGPAIQNAIREQLSGLPDTKAWLQKKLKQLDEIISEKSGEDKLELEKKFNESLSLASVMAMDDDELRTSPLTTPSTSASPTSGASPTHSSSSSSSSSSWLSEQQND